jgi:hypothetical protein
MVGLSLPFSVDIGRPITHCSRIVVLVGGLWIMRVSKNLT